MVQIVKILNHNAILVHDKVNNKVLLLFEKGIGFNKKISETINISKTCEKYEINTEAVERNNVNVVKKLEPIYLEIANEIIILAEEEFGVIDRNILVPLSDHIAFAITRMKEGMDITNPFSNDIRLLYTEEYEVACKGKDLIYEKLGYEINEDEIGYITLHIHSAIGERVDESLMIAVIINESIQKIEKEFGIEIDVTSLSYCRLLTHMKYMLARLNADEKLTLDMEEYTKEKFPYSYSVSIDIIKRIEEVLHKLIPDIEVGYLAMHIERICCLEQD